MNLIKLGIVLLSGLGFGLGMRQNEVIEEVEDTETEYIYGNQFCHGVESFYDHMFIGLPEDEKQMVDEKIEQILVEYELTLEEVLNDFELRYEFMNQLMEFLDDNQIDYHGYNRDYNNDGYRYHHMRRR